MKKRLRLVTLQYRTMIEDILVLFCPMSSIFNSLTPDQDIGHPCRDLIQDIEDIHTPLRGVFVCHLSVASISPFIQKSRQPLRAVGRRLGTGMSYVLNRGSEPGFLTLS